MMLSIVLCEKKTTNFHSMETYIDTPKTLPTSWSCLLLFHDYFDWPTDTPIFMIFFLKKVIQVLLKAFIYRWAYKIF